MSAQDERNRIIRDNVPKLIHSLTKFQPSEPNFQLCEQCAWHTIRNHRNVSVNSHEVRRRIDGVIEKFIVGNYPKHAELFKRLCDDLIAHPLCVNHYELDVQWAIIDFLLNVSYNPVGSIRRSRSNVELVNFQCEENSVENDVEYWVKLLKEDCIPIDQQQCDLVDSDLSDWSECTSDNESSEKQSKHLYIDEDSKSDERFQACASNLGLKPPQKDPHYKLFDTSTSKQWLLDNVQHSWWQENQSNINVKGVNVEANFCRLWSQCMINTSPNYRKFTPISTTSEYCLLREIIWMFQVPTNCKFFSIKNGKIIVNAGVSIPSVTENGLQLFVQQFVPFMEKLLEMQTFINDIHDYQFQSKPPNTYECYANGLKELLKPFFMKLSKMEERIKAQEIGEINTILQLRYEFDKDLEYLEMLHSIHSFSILDYKKLPAHLCSAHLLAGLIHKFNQATSQLTAYTAIVLFLSAVQIFCQIIDTWWTEGRLDDWHNEFLVEKKSTENEEVELRLYEKCKERSFFVPQTVSAVIQQDSFLALLMEHSMEAGCTLNLLYQINKINELKNSCNFNNTLYRSFIEAFTKEISKYKTVDESSIATIENDINQIILKEPIESEFNCPESEKSVDQFWSFQDEFLMMAFKCSSSNFEDNENDDQIDLSNQFNINILNVLNDLVRSSQIILPLENIIVKTFTSILKSRISFANNFVRNMYKNEFEILKHLQNMRKVMMLEACDMHAFYIQLFKQIESGNVWANPFLLTVQLDDILCAKLPDMSSLFCIDLVSPYKCDTTKVIDAIDTLVITYDVNKQLKAIITDKNLQEYNEVFRFLLKVKWGLWALENLQFHRKYKTQPPYAELKMIDLLMRRLEQLRFWMLYAMQSIHFYLMTHILQSMSMKLDERITSCTTLTEMRSVHDSFISTAYNHCFLKSGGHNVKHGIEQLLNLIYVLRYEWARCVADVEDADSTDGFGDEQSSEYLISQLDAIESTYIRCHGYMANVLNNEVYAKQNSHLAGLSAAFNGSVPY